MTEGYNLIKSHPHGAMQFSLGINFMLPISSRTRAPAFSVLPKSYEFPNVASLPRPQAPFTVWVFTDDLL